MLRNLLRKIHAKDKKTDEEIELEGLSKAKEAIEKRPASINVSEDVDALVEGEELSEDFKKKFLRQSSPQLSQKFDQKWKELRKRSLKRLQMKWKHSKLNSQKRLTDTLTTL